MSKQLQVPSQGSTPLFGELLKALSFLTQFQENSNSSMSFSRHTRALAFSSSRPKTRVVWVRKESCFHAFAPFLSCLHAYASFFYAFMLFHMFFFWLFFSFALFCFIYKKNKKKIEKSKKYKNCICFVYIGTCVPWMAIKTKFSKFCISCSLDEHLYA